MKTCNKCGLAKALNAFGKDSRNSDGLQGRCTACKNLENKLRREELVASQNYQVVNEKTCNECLTLKPIGDFYRDKAMGDGRSAICKACKTKRVYAWRAANKDRYNKGQRDYMKAVPAEKRYGAEIKRRYGCTLEQYNQMLLAQGNACAICKSLHNPAVKKGRLFVDHDHSTGVIRQLLCHQCNMILGFAKDDTRILLECVAYLGRHKNKV